MMYQSRSETTGVLKGLFMVVAILAFHLFLVLGLGAMVLLLGGIVAYFYWAFPLVLVGGIFFGYRFFRNLKQKTKNTVSFFMAQVSSGKNVEVRLFGGLASVKVDNNVNLLPPGESMEEKVPPLLEDPMIERIRRLNELAKLLEKNLITLDEYNETKQEIFRTKGL